MSNFNNAVADITKVYQLSNTLNDLAFENAFGKHAKDVKSFNLIMGVSSWVQLYSDVRKKKGLKRIVVNQTVATAIVLGHNLYYSKEVRKAIINHLSK